MPTYADSEPMAISELKESTAQFKQIKFQNSESSYFLKQDILTSFALVRERFDTDLQSGEVELLDGENRQSLTLTKKEFQYIQHRSLHSHGYLEMMVVLSGAVRNYVEGESFTYQAGQGCIMNSHVRHREEPVTDSELLFVALRHEFLRELLQTVDLEKSIMKGKTLLAFLNDALEDSESGMFHKHYLDFSPSGNEAAIRPAQKLLCVDATNALRDRRPGSSFLLRAAILGFLNDLGDATLYTLQSVSSTLSHQEFLVSKIDLLLRASHGKIRKQELEAQLAYNGDYLNRLYKHQKGQSIAEACREVMLHDAKHLLTHSDLSIDEIMHTLGITSRGYFYSQFQNQTGLTPKEYRVSHLTQKNGLSR